jgi:hypothetical protein
MKDETLFKVVANEDIDVFITKGDKYKVTGVEPSDKGDVYQGDWYCMEDDDGDEDWFKADLFTKI